MTVNVRNLWRTDRTGLRWAKEDNRESIRWDTWSKSNRKVTVTMVLSFGGCEEEKRKWQDVCVDFRTLNKIVTLVSFPLPLIDDTLSLLGDFKYFSALDLKSRCWQVKLEENSEEKTAFACNRGLFQFNVIPFGIRNASAVVREWHGTNNRKETAQVAKMIFQQLNFGDVQVDHQHGT